MEDSKNVLGRNAPQAILESRRFAAKKEDAKKVESNTGRIEDELREDSEREIVA